MSWVLFDTIDGQASITHSERTYMSKFCEDLSISHLMDRIDYNDLEKTSKFIQFPNNYWFLKYFNNSDYGIALERDRDIRLILRDYTCGLDDPIKIYDEVLSEWFRPRIYNLNHALRVGNEIVHLMARIHAQCEIHAYVKRDNFDWFKKVIQNGLKNKLLREKVIYENDDGKFKEWNIGWKDVIDLINKTEGNEIVTSFTVCDEFPNALICGMGDEFYDLSSDQKWNLCWNEISKNEGLEIKPEDVGEFYFRG